VTNQRDYNYNPGSPINPNINLEIQVTLLPSHDGNRQSIRWRSRRRSNKYSKEGDSRVFMINRQVKSPPGGSLPRHAPTRLQRSPTDKSKAHLEAVCRDTHRQVYQEVLPTSQKYADRHLYQVDPDSTEAAYRERNHDVDQMVTEADFQRRLPSHCHLPMTTGCKIYSPEHAEALHRAQTALARLNLVSITILEKLT